MRGVFPPRSASPPPVTVVHNVVCRHRAEVEVSPARATVYFADERWIDPANTEVRFEATVYNATGGVSWEVLSPNGGPGAGSIDATGLYRAPNKGALPSGVTDVVAATVRADRLRKAFAWVTLVGLGPLPTPTPKVEIWPKRRNLYYQSGADNAYIEGSNKQQLFRAFLTDSPVSQVRWFVDGALQAGTDPWFRYQTPNAGTGALVTIAVQITGLPAIEDDAKVTLLNYNWPGLP